MYIIDYIKNNNITNIEEEFMTKFNVKVKINNNLAIFNYDIMADFSNPIVQESRGIIIDLNTLKYVCIPFRKFGNYTESYVDTIDWSTARVQEKIDGCVDENTLILTNYGPVHIKDIVNSKRHYKVLTYNHKLQINEFQEIDGISVEENKDKQWYEIETEYGNLRLTGNHKVFCINENQYKRVDELDGTEELQLIEPNDYQLSNKLNQYQKIQELICENIHLQYLNGVSINELSSKYNCDWKLIKKVLIGYYNISVRNISNSKKTRYSQNKTKTTNFKKYGVENVSQSDVIKVKKEQSFLKHFGVTNIRKLPEFYDYINTECLKKFGKKRITNPDKLRETREKNLEKNPNFYYNANKKASQRAIDLWNNLNEKEKELKIKILQEGRHKSNNIKSTRSNIEKRVYNIVKSHTNNCKHTFWINSPKKYSYDIIFNNNKIIEVNGDYWHANPNIYKPNDILNIKGIGSIEAKYIWQKDLNKKNQAENLGYHVIYLWESELNKLTDNQIWDLIQERFNNL